ncbi:MAG: hypothetical protein HYX76_12045 [Acidobacteria bacterium]|nr:hypothetical protein [Acidobacteriota bacterium]
MRVPDLSKQRWAAILIATVGLIVVWAAGRPYAQKRAKPTPNPTAAVTFADREGDDFRSDFTDSLSHSYVHGPDGSGGTIDAQFYVGGSEDLTLNLIRSARKFSGSYTFVGCPDGSLDPSACGGMGNGGFGDGWFINVHKIADMPPGWTQWTTAAFTAAFGQTPIGGRNPKYETLWTFSWCHDGSGAWSTYPDRIETLSFGCGDLAVGQYAHGWQMVLVTRSPNDPQTGQPNYTWTVSADPIEGTPVGDLSGLVERTKTNSTIPHGFYRTRFQLLIACVSGCGVLPG